MLALTNISTNCQTFLKCNCFPSHFMDKIIKQSLKTPRQNPNKNVSNNTENTNIHFLKLPYIGNHSRLTQIKIRQLCKCFCKDLSIKLVFSTFNIKPFFSFKDLIATTLKNWQNLLPFLNTD